MSDISFAASTIVFDLDGTLVDTAPDLVGATNHVLTGLAIAPRSAAELKPWISYGARRMIVEALALSGRRLPEEEADHLMMPFLEYYEANIALESRPFPHVVDAIVELRARGARIAICTNKRESLSLKLIEALDLGKLFDAIVGRDTLDVYKPHPGHLIGTVERAGGAIANAVMVGDSGVDIATARAAGVPAVGVTFGYSETPMAELRPDLLVSDYRKLLGGLVSLSKGR